ncbi:MAG: N-acetyltransferase family protein [Bacteroidia bacterium]
MKSLLLRKIRLKDCEAISLAFKLQGWEKPVAQYERYFQMQEKGTRDIIIAELGQEFAGYLTIQWESNYAAFQSKGIPEVVDFNVLKKFQRKGIGRALMDEAERRVKAVSPICGIGVGMLEDYGAAQILYIKRGYIPDGKGLSYEGKQLKYDDNVIMGDGVVLHLSKKL